MRRIDSNRCIAYITIVAMFASLLSWFIGKFFPNNAIAFLFLMIGIGLLVFGVSRFLINEFIYNKIRILFKAIHDTQISGKELRARIGSEDMLLQAEKEVEDWSKNRGSLVAQLKQQEKYRKEFIGNVSHELKTPIFNIQGYVLTLLDGGLEDESINRDYLERTEKSINRMITIVKDLESISKLESGELRLLFEDFNLDHLIQEVIEMQEMRARKHSITLRYLGNNGDSSMVYADKKEIFQVLNNLIVNSIKYGRDKGITKIEVMDMENKVLVEVKDNGIGIEPDNLPRIFERFYRVDKSRSRNMGGSGLGLAIVKHIVEAHGQNIHVSSTYDVGTSFTFTLEKSRRSYS